MKKVIFTLLIAIPILFYSPQVFSKCCTYCIWHVGGVFYGGDNYFAGNCHFGPSDLDTLLNPSNNIALSLDVAVTGDAGYFVCNTWIHNGDTVYTTNYTVTDTGNYTGVLSFEGCSGHPTAHFNLHVGYLNPTLINELNATVNFFIYPSPSSIFKIKSKSTLAKIQISDSRGRMVLNTSDNLSEINLSTFSDGIYFYAIEDETHKIFRGKIMKN